MTPDASPVKAYRFVYGKAVDEPGAKVLDGFEHRTTTMSTDLPKTLLDQCQAGSLLGNRLIPQVVHKDHQARGALLFWPAVAEDARWMLATCLRARPESGEGGLSRTYTQLTTFVFSEEDWTKQAPRLLWNAATWLKTVPDLKTDYERYRSESDWPMTEFGPALLPDAPPSDQGQLPPPGTKLWRLLWRLTAAIERPSENLLCGAADGIKTIEDYLRTLSWVAALLPPPLRIYLTAAAGFAAEEPPFALQFLPEARAMPAAEPGLLEQFAGQVRRNEETLDWKRWHGFWEPPVDGKGAIADTVRALEKIDGWSTVEEARQQVSSVFDHLSSERSVTDLEGWLDGESPESPARPELHHPRTGQLWLIALTDRINRCLAEQVPKRSGGQDAASGACVGLARAVWRLTTLIDLDPVPAERQRQQADYWAGAWRELAQDAGKESRTRLRWSALMASSLADDDKDDQASGVAAEESWPPRSNPLQDKHRGERIGQDMQIGVIANLHELWVLIAALRQANAGAGADAAALQAALTQAQPAFGRRIDALRQRAEALLVRDPLSIRDLAAAAPNLFACRTEKPRLDDNRRRETVMNIVYASALMAEGRGENAQDRGYPVASLADAARAVAEASYAIQLGDPAELRATLATQRKAFLKAFLERYWRWVLAPETRIEDITSAARPASPLVEEIVATANTGISRPRYLTPTEPSRTASPPPLLFWRDAILLLMIDAIKKHGISDPLRVLMQSCAPACDAVIAPDSDHTRPELAARALMQSCLTAIDKAAPDKTDLSEGLLRALPDLRWLALEPDLGTGQASTNQAVQTQAFTSESVAAVIDFELATQLNERLMRAIQDAEPQAVLERLLPVFNAELARVIHALGRVTAPPRLAKRVLSIASYLIEHKAIALRTRMPRAPVVELFCQLEQFAAKLPPPGRLGGTPGYLSDVKPQLDHLSRLLARCILIWFEADPNGFHLAWEPQLIQDAPIRRRLAGQLQYPRCTYFAGLTPADAAVAKLLPPRVYDTTVYQPDDMKGLSGGLIDPRESQTIQWLKLKDPEEQLAAKQLIAMNATRLWRRLLGQGTWEKQDVDALLNHDSRWEVFNALDHTAAVATDDYANLIDAETRFVVDFYRSLRRKDVDLDTQMEIPESLRQALLSNGNNFSTCYAIRLGRAIATSQTRLTDLLLHELFDHPQSNANFAKRVLLFGRPWDRVETLNDTAEWTNGLLRTLFLLALIASEERRSNTADKRKPISHGKIQKALKAPKQATDTLENAMRRLQEAAGQDHQADYPFAFRHALARAGVPELPGWPASCQPLK